jgi:hypothetical protein
MTMVRHLFVALVLLATLALPARSTFACGQDEKDVQAMIPLAQLGDKAEAEAKALLAKANELCTQGKAEEAKPYIDQARLVANFG